MLEPVDDHSGKSVKFIIISLIASALALGGDFFFNSFSKIHDYLVYFALSVLLIGVMYLYVVFVSDKRLASLIKILSENVGMIKDITKGQLLIPIEEASRMESQAEEEIFIISRDPELELNEEFLGVVCRNLIRNKPIKYYYFFPQVDDPDIDRGIKKMLNAFKNFENGNKVTETVLKKQLNIYRVNYILNNIVVIDPYGKKPAGWIFPNAEFEHHIIHADKYLIKSAIRQVQSWMKTESDKIYPPPR